jgi:outer membrane protein OmpA-like peptidoglycan-associated protein
MRFSYINIMMLFAPLLIWENAAGQQSDSTIKAPVQVVVIDFENRPMEGEQIIFEGLNSKRIYRGVSNYEGKFDILLEGGETYLIKIKGVGEAKDYNRFELPLLGENESYGKTTLTIQFEQPKVFTLDNVEFETGKSSLTQESYSELEELREYMQLKEDLVVEIAGHTDNVGDEESNMRLSEARANTVRNYLISKGISPDRIIAKGYGESQPIAPNSSDEGRQRNRRTEVRVKK